MWYCPYAPVRRIGRTGRNGGTDGWSHCRPLFPAFSPAQARPPGDGADRYQCRFRLGLRYSAGRCRIRPGSHCHRKDALRAILPAFLSAAFAHLTCVAWGVAHTHYPHPVVPSLNVETILWTILAGIFSGWPPCASRAASVCGDGWLPVMCLSSLRPLLGGIVIALAVWLLGTTKYIGLGVPTIVASFPNSRCGTTSC